MRLLHSPGKTLLRAAGALAGRALAKARGTTLRRDLVTVPARTARQGRGRITLRLPRGWHRAREWPALFEAACGPPATAAWPAPARSRASRSRKATPNPALDREPAGKPRERRRREDHTRKPAACASPGPQRHEIPAGGSRLRAA